MPIKLDLVQNEIQNKERQLEVYSREDISRVLPQKRFATSEGPGYLVQISVKAAWTNIYCWIPQDEISFATLVQLSPRNVKKMISSHSDSAAAFTIATSDKNFWH